MPPPSVIDTGIPKLDRLLADAAEPALQVEDGDKERLAVGVVEDLFNRFDRDLSTLRPLMPAPREKWLPLPLPSHERHGVFNKKLEAFVKAFQTYAKIPVNGQVDHVTLKTLVAQPQKSVLITPGQFIFEYELKYTHFLKAVVLTGGKECSFDFTKMNLNTDRAGLSIGVLHWSQKPGRLHDLMMFLRDRSPGFGDFKFLDCYFGGTAEILGVIDHLHKASGGLDPSTGKSMDPNFEFAMQAMVVRKYWPSCFYSMLSTRWVQKEMTDYAVRTFRKLYDDSYGGYPGSVSNLTGRNLKVYAPKLTSQRAIVFALDMINQHGGRVKTLYSDIVGGNPQATEQQVLEGLREGARQFWLSQNRPKAVREKNAEDDSNRRDFFLKTPHLSSDVAFDPT